MTPVGRTGSTRRSSVGGLLIAGSIAGLATSTSNAQCFDQKIIATEGEPFDRIGQTVALHDDLAVIGGQGRAFAVRLTDAGPRQVELVADDASVWFGARGAAAGDDLAIVSEHNAGAGSVHVFRSSPGGLDWEHEIELVASDAKAGDDFGNEVAVDGDRLAVAALAESWKGAVYVFDYVDGTWTETVKLTLPDAQDLDTFGGSIALQGDRLVIGAYRRDDMGENAGAVYVYERTNDIWELASTLFPEDAAPEQFFGFSVAVDGDAIVAGTWLSQVTPVYVFRFDGATWNQEACFESPTIGDDFGFSLAIEGDTVLVGAPEHPGGCPRDDDVFCETGAAFLFEHDDGDWTQNARLEAHDPVGRQEFGLSVALSGDRALIGAKQDDDHGDWSGSAYLYRASGPDCNGNQIPDCQEVADGTADDCDRNGVLDACELNDDGADCNANKTLDACEALVVWESTSPQLSPIGEETPQTYVIDDAPRAFSDAIVQIEVLANVGAGNGIEVRLNGDPVAHLFENGFGGLCDAPPAEMTIAAARINDAVQSGSLAFEFVPDNFILENACGGTSWISMRIEYLAAGPLDANQNSVLDACECIGDVSGDGVIGLADLSLLLSGWGPCPGCAADLNGNGRVGFDDLLDLLAMWGTC